MLNTNHDSSRADVLNVRQFGATGDGEMDDTQAIQRAIIFTGNTMITGRDDFSQGNYCPDYAVVYGGLESSIIKDNVLHHGAVRQLMLDLGGNNDETVIVRDNVGLVGESGW